MASNYHSSFVLALRQSLRKRLSYYEEQEVYIIASILDPRIKLQWCFEDTEKKNYTDMILLALEQDVPPAPVYVGDITLDPPPSKRAKSLFSFMPEPSLSRATTTTCANELDDYLQSPCAPMKTNPAEFWKKERNKYPHSTKLAREVLGEPSSFER